MGDESLAGKPTDFRVSEELNRRIIEAMPGGIVQVAADGNILRANAEALRILGMSHDAVTNRYTQDWDPETIWEDGSPCPVQNYPVTQALLTGKAQPPATIGIRRPDGQVSWAVFTAVPVMSPDDGSVSGAVVTFIDITKRKQTEQALTESEARLRSIVESIPAFVSMVDPELRIQYVNRVLHAESAEAVKHASVLDFLVEEDRERVRAELEHVLASGQVESIEARTIPLYGSLEYRIAAGPVRYGEEIGGLMLIAHDITHEKTMEARLLLADRLSAIGTLAAGVAHEINNPLTYLLGNLELLKRALEEQSHPLARVRDALDGAQRIREVVRDLMTFSHQDSDAQGPVHASDAIDRAVRMAQHEIKHRAVLIRDFSPVREVRGSASRLSQVLLNLLLNAAHAIAPGNVERNQIRISTRALSEDRVRISVHDTGLGMDRALLARIFDPFVTTKPQGQGTGLGLYVCHNIVQGMGGAIWAESEPGKGSSFHVDLPAFDGRTSRPPSRPSPLPARRLPPGLCILLVDDEPSIVSLVEGSLSDHRVVCVSSGRDAIAALEDASYDAILCDLVMPDLTGLDVYRYLQDKSPELARRFLFVTGAAQGELLRGLPPLKVPVLRKPFDMDELEQALAELLRARQ